jgi:type IV secretion system protein VirB4
LAGRRKLSQNGGNGMIENANKTKQELGFSEILTYLTLVNEGVVECKNGALLAGFWYEGPDLESATVEEVEVLTAFISRAFARFGGGWMLHVEMIRKPTETYPRGFFNEPTNYLIDAERAYQHKQEGSHFESKIGLFFTYLPPLLEQSSMWRKIVNFLMGDGETTYLEMSQKNLRHFEDKLSEIEDILTASKQIKLKRMLVEPVIADDGEKFLNFQLLEAINYVVNGRWHPVRLPNPCPTYLDTLFARDMLAGSPLIYDDNKLAIISVVGYPHGSYPGILQAINRLPYEARFSNRFIFTDYLDASEKLQKLRKQWAQKMRSFISILLNRPDAPINLDAASMVEDIDSAIMPLESGDICFGHHTCVVVIRGKDDEELDYRAREVTKIFEFRGFAAKIEKRNGFEAFIGSLPGHGYENVRRPMINSLNYSDIIPTTTDWTGKEFCPSGHFPPNSPALIQAASMDSTPFRLNLHDGDVGHTLILGPTGAGKSTLLSLIASQFERYEGSRVFVFDKGYSMFPLAAACLDAAHYDIGAPDETGKRLRFCPLATIDSSQERLGAQEWIETIVVLSQDASCTPDQRELIHSALQTMANTTRDASERTMTHFLGTIQDMKLREILNYYAGEHPGGILLDGDSNDIHYKHLTVFEMEHVYNMSEKLVVPIFVYLFREIEKRLNETVEGKMNPPSLIIIDEAWTALNHPMFQEKLAEWLLVLRKKNCAVVMATQNLSHILDSPIRQTILDSCFTRILLPNPAAMNEDLKKLYMGYLNLNAKQVMLIAEVGIMKKHYYYTAPNSRNYRLFDLGLDEVALAFVGAAGKDDLKAIRALIKKYGKTWPSYWLEQRGLKDWGEEWLKRYDLYMTHENSQEEAV